MKKFIHRPAAFILTSTDHGSMLVNRHDYRLIGDGGYGVGFQLLNTSSFDHEEVNLALQLLEVRKQHFGEGVVAIDCGANVGVHTIEWAKFMYGWGNVIAFEAQERIFYALAGNIAINNCFNARAIWAAVGAGEGSINVPVPDYFKPSSFGSLEIRKTESTEYIGQVINYAEEHTLLTPMISIDSMNLPRVDLIKIDIEGMEMEALEGAASTISKSKPQLLIEKIKSNEQELSLFLSSRGYKIFTLGINLLAIHESDPLARVMEERQVKAEPGGAS
ncbi:MAG: FkbM family methyltransferase [Oxalobacter sp.]|nr:FkbM family methyltransferase [Oxalobacter sp.]